MVCGLQFSSSPCFPKNVATCISVAAFLSKIQTEMPESTGLKTFFSGMSSFTWDMTAGVKLLSGKCMDVRSPLLMGVGFLRQLKKKTFLRLKRRMSGRQLCGMTSLGPEVPFPLIPSGKRCRWDSAVRSQCAESLFPGGAGSGVVRLVAVH